jgi:hypothetical protein
MKTRTIAGLLAAPFLISSPALAATGAARGAPSGIAIPASAPAQPLRRHDAILAIRDEALTLQAADGGTLTDAHRAYLQAKLDAVREGIY